MKLKQAVIKVILSLSKGDNIIQEAQTLHRELFPTLPIPNTTKALITALGTPLRQDTIPDRQYPILRDVSITPKREVKKETPPPPVHIKETQGTIPTARTELVEGLEQKHSDLMASRAYYHQQLISATSDQQRRTIRKDQAQNQNQLSEIRGLIKEAEKGNPVQLPVVKKSKADQYMIIPAGQAEKELKIKKLSANRSKKKKIMDDNPEGSDKWIKASAEYRALNTAITTIRDAKDQQIQQESATENR